MPATGGVPTLSQVRRWTTEHLTEGAEFWVRTAVVWEDRFTELANRISMPGGTPWEGEAADAAFTRAHTDRMTVIGLADELHTAARIARTGAAEISSARDAALRVVDAAAADGFVIREDFSVTSPGYFDPVTAAVRQAQAESIATELRATVGTLVATDAEVAASLTAATAGLGTDVFPDARKEAPVSSHVQLVEYRNFKQGPPIPDPGLPGDPVGKGAGPSAPEILGVTRDLPEGSRPNIKLVQTPRQLSDFYQWATQNGVQVPDAYGPGSGTASVLPDGTRIGMREAAGSTRQPAIDIKYPDGNWEKIHINAPKGGVPKLPLEGVSARPQIKPEPPRVRAFPGEPLPRGIGAAPLEPPGMPTLVPPPHPYPETELPTLGEHNAMPGDR